MSPQTPALRNTVIALALSILCCAQAPMPEPVTDQETELGDQMYKELKAKGEIVASSPLYDTLKPIADSISRAAQSRYFPSSSSSFTSLSLTRSPRQGATSMSWIPCSIS
jgi:hypothetical protein